MDGRLEPRRAADAVLSRAHPFLERSAEVRARHSLGEVAEDPGRSYRAELVLALSERQHPRGEEGLFGPGRELRGEDELHHFAQGVHALLPP